MPTILEPTDAIIKLAATCIWPDLWSLPRIGAGPRAAHGPRVPSEQSSRWASRHDRCFRRLRQVPSAFLRRVRDLPCWLPSRCTTAAAQGDALSACAAGGTPMREWGSPRKAILAPGRLPTFSAPAGFRRHEAGRLGRPSSSGDGAVGLGAIIGAGQLGASCRDVSRHAGPPGAARESLVDRRRRRARRGRASRASRTDRLACAPGSGARK